MKTDSGYRLYCKGASEIMLRLCTKKMTGSGDVLPLEGEFEESGGTIQGSGEKRQIGEEVRTRLILSCTR